MLNKLNATKSSNINSRHMKNQSGFSLIEIMIVVSIIGVLTLIAYPSYLEQVRKSTRGELVANVLECASIQERVYTVNNTYDDTSCAALNNDNDNYDITLTTGASSGGGAGGGTRFNSFIITAEAIGRMADDDRCAEFTYTDRGLKGAEASDSTNTTDICWRD